MKPAIGSLFAGIMLATLAVHAADWPEWCGQPSRNRVATTETGLPSWFVAGKEKTDTEVDLSKAKNVKWMARVGGTCGSPVVSHGRVFIGSQLNTASLLCFDEQTGRELACFICQKPPKEKDVQRCAENWGVCSTPTVEEDRVYFVSPYQEVFCLDLKALLDQPHAQSTTRPDSPDAEKNAVAAAAAASEKCVLWKYDLAKELKAVQQHTASCSVLVHGNCVYVCTGNGRWMTPGANYFPLMPSLVALNKTTGQLVARDDEQIGERLWRGQWSSPSMGVVDGKVQIYFGAGDGACYAFEPVDPNIQVLPNRWLTTTLRGPIIRFVDVDPAKTGGVAATQPIPKSPFAVETRYSIKLPSVTPLKSIPTAKVPDVPILKKIWSCDCIPKEYRENPFYSSDAKGDGKGIPCEITGTPVFYKNRVYVAIGGDPQHGGRNSKGNLVCMDATKTGDITQTGQIWNYDKMNQSLSTVAIANGLVFAMDEANAVHCLDADTGQCYWTYPVDSKGSFGFRSPLVADGKVFAGKSILLASKELKLLNSMNSAAYSSPCVANGVLFTVCGHWLTAVCDKGDKP